MYLRLIVKTATVAFCIARCNMIHALATSIAHNARLPQLLSTIAWLRSTLVNSERRSSFIGSFAAHHTPSMRQGNTPSSQLPPAKQHSNYTALSQLDVLSPNGLRVRAMHRSHCRTNNKDNFILLFFHVHFILLWTQFSTVSLWSRFIVPSVILSWKLCNLLVRFTVFNVSVNWKEVD